MGEKMGGERGEHGARPRRIMYWRQSISSKHRGYREEE
jgi:hypothetical protein